MSDFLSFGNLLTVSRTLPALKQFIEGDVLGKVLSEVGDAELIAASHIFNNLDSSADKGKALNRALVHLESAHELFKRSAISVMDSFNGFSITFNIGQYIEWQYKDIYICLLIALCHRYMNDDRKIIEEKIHWAIQAFKGYPGAPHAYSRLEKMMPITFPIALFITFSIGLGFPFGQIKMMLNKKHRFYWKLAEDPEATERLIEEVRDNLLSI
ncbi:MULTISPECIES: hypothetical protein [Okeania]|uniref:hypothetical protein n=1 Tax=Okeania TaxID=1458928 RepID=UPI000F53D66B|nr:MULTISPECIES: hypothetical protein [Okeania]NES88725.1 hypothetical protein [Okeania sp. SIO2B9]NET74780.1 hypothetical protein [Okeania sp. SIO1F9]RQH18518.1 hypothetical protein D4Z78_15550 [Okeania hirsuta]